MIPSPPLEVCGWIDEKKKPYRAPEAIKQIRDLEGELVNCKFTWLVHASCRASAIDRAANLSKEDQSSSVVEMRSDIDVSIPEMERLFELYGAQAFFWELTGILDAVASVHIKDLAPAVKPNDHIRANCSLLHCASAVCRVKRLERPTGGTVQTDLFLEDSHTSGWSCGRDFDAKLVFDEYGFSPRSYRGGHT